MTSTQHKILMNGIKRSITSKNPYECMKVANRLSHSCGTRGVDETITMCDQYLSTHSCDAYAS